MITDITVPGGPINDLAVNPDTNRLYVIRANQNDIAVFDTITHAILTIIPIESRAECITVDRGTNRIYASRSSANSVTVIDGVSNTVLTTVSVGNYPLKIGIHPGTHQVYVPNAGSNSVSVIDGAVGSPTENTILATIPVDVSPIAAAVDPEVNAVYVTNSQSGTVSVIDGSSNTVIHTVATAIQPSRLSLIPDLGRVFVETGDHAVSVLGPSSGTVSGNVLVETGGILGGTGAISGAVTMAGTGGHLAPGVAVGRLTVDNDVTLDSHGSFDVDLSGHTASSGYDQLRVTGLGRTVALNNAVLNVSLDSYIPAAGETFTIIDNRAVSSTVSGTFFGLPEGASVTVGETVLKISYVGGDGNDVVLWNTDVTVYIPDDLLGAPGVSVSVPVKFAVHNLAGVTIGGFDVVIEYDASRLTVSSSQLGALLTAPDSDFTGTLSTPAAGKLIYVADSANGSALFAHGTVGDLFTVVFTVAGNAPAGALPINLLASHGATITALFENSDDDLLLLPAPTNAATDSIDGVVTIDATPPSATNVTVSDTLLSDADTGTGKTFTVTVAFSEAMAATLAPVLTFSPAVIATLSIASGGWTDNTRYTATYNVADANVIVDAVQIDVTEAKDVAGNVQQDYTPEDEFGINTNFVVTSLTPTSTGFRVRFSQDLDPSVLNLVDQGGALGPVDIILAGAAVGDVRGSFVISPGLREATFIKTALDPNIPSARLLEVDQYTVTLKSGSTAFRDTGGSLLDGDGNSTPGDDYVAGFTVSAPAANAVTVSLSDVTRGYGQPVNLPANVLTAGLPLTISNGLGVTRMELEIHYDPSLLDISAFTLHSAVALRGAQRVLDTSTPGLAVLTITAPNGLAGVAGPLAVGSFTAQVPNDAPYGGKQILDLADLHIYNNATPPVELPAIDDDAIHVAAFLGDTNGDGRYNSPDATLMRRIIGQVNSGFSAFQLTDPVLIADITLNNLIQSNDTMSIRRAIGQVAVPNIPALPTGLTFPAASGPDPRVYIPRDLAGAPGATLTVPVMIEVTEPAGLMIGGFDIVVEFDADKFIVS